MITKSTTLDGWVPTGASVVQDSHPICSSWLQWGDPHHCIDVSVQNVFYRSKVTHHPSLHHHQCHHNLLFFLSLPFLLLFRLLLLLLCLVLMSVRTSKQSLISTSLSSVSLRVTISCYFLCTMLGRTTSFLTYGVMRTSYKWGLSDDPGTLGNKYWE